MKKQIHYLLIKRSVEIWDLGQTEIVKKWWAFMKHIMDTNPDNSPVSAALEEVFYLE